MDDNTKLYSFLYDGDTLYRDHNGDGKMEPSEGYRSLGVDAPEVGFVGHKEVTQRLRELSGGADSIQTDPVGKGTFGRNLTFFKDQEGNDLTEQLVREGLVSRKGYDGKESPYLFTPTQLPPWVDELDLSGPNADAEHFRRTQKRGMLNEFTEAIHRGVDTTKATGYGAVAALGDLFGSDAAKEFGLEGMYEAMRDAAENPAAVPSYEDIDSLADLGRYVVATLGEFLPQIALTGGTALTGRLAAAGVGSAMVKKIGHKAYADFLQKRGMTHVANESYKNQIRSNALSKAKAMSGKGVERMKRRGTQVGAVSGILPQTVGENVLEADAEGVINGAASLAVGGLNAGIEFLSLGKIFGGLLDIAKRGDQIGLADAAKRTFGSFGIEATQELIQDTTNQLSVMAQSDKEYDGVQALDSFFKGGIGGGTPTLVAGLTRAGLNSYANYREQVRRLSAEDSSPDFVSTAPFEGDAAQTATPEPPTRPPSPTDNPPWMDQLGELGPDERPLQPEPEPVLSLPLHEQTQQTETEDNRVTIDPEGEQVVLKQVREFRNPRHPRRVVSLSDSESAQTKSLVWALVSHNARPLQNTDVKSTVFVRRKMLTEVFGKDTANQIWNSGLISDEQVSTLHGYVQTKQEVTQAQSAGNDAVVVSAIDRDGDVVDSEAVSQDRIDEAAAAVQQRNPDAEITVSGPQEALEYRKQRLLVQSTDPKTDVYGQIKEDVTKRPTQQTSPLHNLANDRDLHEAGIAVAPRDPESAVTYIGVNEAELSADLAPEERVVNIEPVATEAEAQTILDRQRSRSGYDFRLEQTPEGWHVVSSKTTPIQVLIGRNITDNPQLRSAFPTRKDAEAVLRSITNTSDGRFQLGKRAKHNRTVVSDQERFDHSVVELEDGFYIARAPIPPALHSDTTVTTESGTVSDVDVYISHFGVNGRTSHGATRVITGQGVEPQTKKILRALNKLHASTIDKGYIRHVAVLLKGRVMSVNLTQIATELLPFVERQLGAETSERARNEMAFLYLMAMLHDNGASYVDPESGVALPMDPEYMPLNLRLTNFTEQTVNTLLGQSINSVHYIGRSDTSTESLVLRVAEFTQSHRSQRHSPFKVGDSVAMLNYGRLKNRVVRHAETPVVASRIGLSLSETADKLIAHVLFGLDFRFFNRKTGETAPITPPWAKLPPADAELIQPIVDLITAEVARPARAATLDSRLAPKEHETPELRLLNAQQRLAEIDEILASATDGFSPERFGALQRESDYLESVVIELTKQTTVDANVEEGVDLGVDETQRRNDSIEAEFRTRNTATYRNLRDRPPRTFPLPEEKIAKPKSKAEQKRDNDARSEGYVLRVLRDIASVIGVTVDVTSVEPKKGSRRNGKVFASVTMTESGIKVTLSRAAWEGLISPKPKVKLTALLTVAHELGHLWYIETFRSMPESVKTKLRQDYDKSRGRNAESHQYNSLSYEDGFEEYVADQVSGYVRRYLEGKKTRVGGAGFMNLFARQLGDFIKKLGTAVHGLFKALTNNYQDRVGTQDETVASVFDSFLESWRSVPIAHDSTVSAFMAERAKVYGVTGQDLSNTTKELDLEGHALFAAKPLTELFPNASAATRRVAVTSRAQLAKYPVLSKVAKFVSSVLGTFANVAGRIALTSWRRLAVLDLPLANAMADFLRMKSAAAGVYLNRLHAVEERYGRERYLRALQYAQQELPLEQYPQSYQPIITDIRRVFRQVLDYYDQRTNVNLHERNMRHVQRRSNYFTRVFDTEKLISDRDAFIAILTNPASFSDGNALGVDEARQVVRTLSEDMGVYEGLFDLSFYVTPAASTRGYTRKRSLERLNSAAVADFLAEPEQVIHSYISALTRRAESNARFAGMDRLDVAFRNLEERISAGIPYDPEQYRILLSMKNANVTHVYNPTKAFDERIHLLVSNGFITEAKELSLNLDAQFGRLNTDLSPHIRDANGVLNSLQFYSTLAFAALASVVDLGVIALRTREWGGLADVAKSITSPADARELARNLGVIHLTASGNATAFLHGEQYFDRNLQALNDKFFRVTGLEYWTRFTRSVATLTAQKFVEKHLARARNNDERSLRYLADLGINDINNVTQAHKNFAYVKFADEAIMRPDAAQRPVWASDPLYLSVWALKSYFYSFGHKVIGPLAREIGQRYKTEGAINAIAPLAIAAVTTLPLAALGLELREFLQFTVPGELGFDEKVPTSDKQNIEDYLLNITSRSGWFGPAELLTGLGRYGSSATTDLLGPTAQTLDVAFNEGLWAGLVRLMPVVNQLPAVKDATIDWLERD